MKALLIPEFLPTVLARLALYVGMPIMRTSQLGRKFKIRLLPIQNGGKKWMQSKIYLYPALFMM